MWATGRVMWAPRMIELVPPDVIAAADVDEAKKNELKEQLINYDRTLLVAGESEAWYCVNRRMLVNRWRLMPLSAVGVDVFAAQTPAGASPRSSVAQVPALGTRSRTDRPAAARLSPRPHCRVFTWGSGRPMGGWSGHDARHRQWPRLAGLAVCKLSRGGRC